MNRIGVNTLLGLSACAVILGLSARSTLAQDAETRRAVVLAQSVQAGVKPQAAAKPANAKPQPSQAPAARSAAAAGDAPRTGLQAAPRASKPYFIEFRARSAYSYGHTFVVHGRVGQKITPAQVVGLHPATDSPIPWMIGHLVLVPSETGASDGDTEDQYVVARYRIALSEPEYRKLTAFMKKLQDSSPVWHAVLYNCNAFVADIAKSMGLRTPSSTMLMPKEFITELRHLNATPKQAAADGAAETR